MESSNSAVFVITQVRSHIRIPRNQRRILCALGLGKRLNRSVERSDTKIIRGMLNKVAHLVNVSKEVKHAKA